MDNGEGIDCGQKRWAGWREAKGKKIETTLMEQTTKNKVK